MKYWNKKKNCREHWTTVIVNAPFYQAKLWCQRHESKGRFYSGPYSSRDQGKWYFEFSDDALAFKLRYYGQRRIQLDPR